MKAREVLEQAESAARIAASKLAVRHDREGNREMKMRGSRRTALAATAATLVLLFGPGTSAFALISDSSISVPPPNGWDQVCSPASIDVTPGTRTRTYLARGTCWINTAQDKTDANKQSWTQAQVTANGVYSLHDNSFRETLTINKPSGPATVSFTGTCDNDPWASKANCSDKNSPNGFLTETFGWIVTGKAQGPLSPLVFSPGLVQSLLEKKESKPPVAPVGLDAVRWPTNGGKSAIGNVKWRAGDMSNNQWVLQFDIEYSNYADSTFTKAGARVGLGPKQNMSGADANRVYVFSTPFALQSGTDYYFRVCAVNDAGRQCSAAVKARQPSKMELASVASSIHTSAGLAGGQSISPPTAPPGAGGMSGVRKLGGIRRLGGAGNVGGTPGTTPGGRTGGLGSQRPTVVAKTAPRSLGGTTPAIAGGAAKPDLAVAREGMLVNDRPVAWSGMNRLVLHTDASNTCPIRVSLRYMNLGKAAATNVTAEVRDSLQPTQPLATNTMATLTPGQSASVSGIGKIAASPSTTRVVVTGLVRENGNTQDANVTNNRGTITLEVLCQAGGVGTLTPAHASMPRTVGGIGARKPLAR